MIAGDGVAACFSDFDFPFEDEIRRTGESDVFESLIAGFLKTDFQRVPAFDIYLDRAGRAGEQVVDEGGGDHAGAAGECLVLHAALVGADGNVVGREHCGEVRVGPGRGEGRVIADRGTVVVYVEFVERFRAVEEC